MGKTWLVEDQQEDHHEGVAGTDRKHETIASLKQIFLDMFLLFELSGIMLIEFKW